MKIVLSHDEIRQKFNITEDGDIEIVGVQGISQSRPLVPIRDIESGGKFSRRLTPVEKDNIKRMLRNGNPVPHIADIFKVSEATVYNIKRIEGIKSTKGKTFNDLPSEMFDDVELPEDKSDDE